MYLNRDNLIALLVMCLLGACTQSEKLQGLKEAAIPGPPNAVNVNFCTDVPAQQKFAHKMVIILDHSGSNKSNFLLDANGAILLSGNPPVPTFSTALGTDPKGTLRYGNITTD